MRPPQIPDAVAVCKTCKDALADPGKGGECGGCRWRRLCGDAPEDQAPLAYGYLLVSTALEAGVDPRQRPTAPPPGLCACGCGLPASLVAALFEIPDRVSAEAEPVGLLRTMERTTERVRLAVLAALLLAIAGCCVLGWWR